MYDFIYHRPTSLADAVETRNSADDGQFMAGGQTMIPVLRQRLAMPSDVVDLGALAELKGISVEAGVVTVKAMTTHAAVAASDAVRSAIPALADLALLIGDPQVRHRGTIGGSIANNDPAADYPAAVLGLGATVRTDRREIAGDDFFLDIFTTALDDGELITAVDFPAPDVAAYEKFPHPASRFALVGVMVSKGKAGVRVAVTGAGPCVFRVPEMEATLARDFSAKALESVAVDADGLNSDIHAAADYRAHLIGVLARRAVKKIA
jgi:carbon-monoxide dehydrogenase medium subunit